MLQAYAGTVDDAFQLQYGLASTTQRYMAKWALSEVLGLMHRYLQVGSRGCCENGGTHAHVFSRLVV